MIREVDPVIQVLVDGCIIAYVGDVEVEPASDLLGLTHVPGAGGDLAGTDAGTGLGRVGGVVFSVDDLTPQGSPVR